MFIKGLQVWQRGQVNHQLERDVQFTLEKMAKELRNTFQFAGLSFKGTASDITFPSYVAVQTAGPESPIRQGIGTVSYFWDSSEKKLMRRQKTYDELFQRFQEPKAEVILAPVEDFKVQYYFFDSTLKSYGWKENWDEADPAPLGAKVIVTVKNNAKEEDFVKTVQFPAAVGKN